MDVDRASSDTCSICFAALAGVLELGCNAPPGLLTSSQQRATLLRISGIGFGFGSKNLRRQKSAAKEIRMRHEG